MHSSCSSTEKLQGTLLAGILGMRQNAQAPQSTIAAADGFSSFLMIKVEARDCVRGQFAERRSSVTTPSFYPFEATAVRDEEYHANCQCLGRQSSRIYKEICHTARAGPIGVLDHAVRYWSASSSGDAGHGMGSERTNSLPILRSVVRDGSAQDLVLQKGAIKSTVCAS